MIQEILQKLLGQISSGRFILTCICGVAFGVMAVQKILEPKDSLLIFTLVFSSYFQKPTEPKTPAGQ
jgi:hypothetical protein